MGDPVLAMRWQSGGAQAVFTRSTEETGGADVVQLGNDFGTVESDDGVGGPTTSNSYASNRVLNAWGSLWARGNGGVYRFQGDSNSVVDWSSSALDGGFTIPERTNTALKSGIYYVVADNVPYIAGVYNGTTGTGHYGGFRYNLLTETLETSNTVNDAGFAPGNQGNYGRSIFYNGTIMYQSDSNVWLFYNVAANTISSLEQSDPSPAPAFPSNSYAAYVVFRNRLWM